MWRTGNLHPTRGLYATFQEVVFPLNQPNGQTAAYPSLQIPVKITPDLGCKYQHISGEWYEYIYQPISACFTDDSDCIGPMTIAKRPPVGDCFQSSDYCIKFDLTRLHSGPDVQAARSAASAILNLIKTKPPLKTNVSNLLALGACNQRYDATVSAANEFQDIGVSCSASFLVQNKTAKALRITVPIIFGGTFAQMPGTSASISPRDPSKSPILEWFDQDDKSMGIEHIARVDFVTTNAGNPQIKILGDTHFCILITLPKP